MTLSFSVFLQFSNVHVDSSPIEVQRADALCDFLQMPTNAGKSGSTLAGEFWRGHLHGVSGTLGFPLERRVSLMLITILVAATGVNRTQPSTPPRSRREALVCLDVSHTAAATFPPSRRCRVNGALLGELPLVTGLAPLLQTNLRAEPSEQLYATDASPSGALRPSHRKPGSPCTIRLRRQESTSALMGKAKNHRATCAMVVQLLSRLQ